MWWRKKKKDKPPAKDIEKMLDLENPFAEVPAEEPVVEVKNTTDDQIDDITDFLETCQKTEEIFKKVNQDPMPDELQSKFYVLFVIDGETEAVGPFISQFGASCWCEGLRYGDTGENFTVIGVVTNLTNSDIKITKPEVGALN